MIHLYHDSFILLFLNDTFYIVAALEFGVVSVVIELDAHGDTLLYLYEVTCGIVDRDEREGAACGIGDALHGTCISYAWYGIGCNLHLVANLDVRKLAFLIVGLNPALALIDDAHQGLAWVDQLTYVDVFRTNGTIAGGDDVAIGEVEASEIYGTTSQFDALFRGREVMSLLGYDCGLGLARAKRLLITSLGAQIACVNLVVLLTGYSILTEELLETGILTLGVLHLHTCCLDASVGYAHAGLGGHDAACRSLCATLRTDEVSLGLRQSQTELGVLDDGERIALIHLLELSETYLTDETLHTAVLWHDVLANMGIVGELSATEVHELACCIGSSAQEASYDEDII